MYLTIFLSNSTFTISEITLATLSTVIVFVVGFGSEGQTEGGTTEPNPTRDN